MNRHHKKLFCILLVGILFLSSVHTMNTYAAGNIRVTINGKALVMDQPPVTIGGRTLVPLRAIFEGLGATVQWDSNTQSITGIKGNTLITLMIGSTTAKVGNKRVALDVPGQIVNGRTLVPVRFVAESLGAVVVWDGANKVVKITANVNTPAITQATAEEYMTTFDLTATVFNENVQAYAEALGKLGMGHDVLEEIEELNRIHRETYDDFSSISDLAAFTQSQFFMNSALFNYGLVLDQTEAYIKDLNAGKDQATLVKTLAEIDLFLVRMEADFNKAEEFFTVEAKAYVEAN